MSHAKIDNLYDDVRKIKRAWRAHPPNPVGLHVMAITWCQRHRTDGCVPDEWLEEMIPKVREREVVVDTMVVNGMFDRDPHEDGEYRVHDFLDYNESAAERKKRADAARTAAHARWGNKNGTADSYA